MTVTLKMLQNKIDYINDATGSPMEPYTRIDGRIQANIGNYHISQAYGGFALMRMATEGGGITMPTNSSHITKRELCHQLDGFIAALRAMQ
jgi:hypothetical protein